MNSIDKATNEKVGMAALTLIMLTLLIFTAGTTVLLQAQTDPADAKIPAVCILTNQQFGGETQTISDGFARKGLTFICASPR